MKKLPLSTKERKVWEYILGYFADNDYAPTRGEIAMKVGEQNPLKGGAANIQTILENMAAKGYIKFGKRSWRNIIIVNQK